MTSDPLHLGLDVGGSSIKVVAVEADGNVVRRDRVDIDPAGDPADAAVRVGELLAGVRPAGIGLGCAGTIDHDAGVVLESPNLPAWSGAPIRELFSQALGGPVEIDNDANCAAIGEHWVGAGRGARSLVVVTLGTGIGGGIVLEDRIWRGASGTAGEIGHVPIAPEDGPPCGCGSRGCLETFASATAIVRMAREAIGRGESSAMAAENLTAADVARAARAGDAVALRVFRIAGRYLGLGFAVLANLLNPERVVVVGGLAASWDLLETPALRALEEAAFERPRAALAIRKGTLGDLAGAIGAARLSVVSGPEPTRTP